VYPSGVRGKEQSERRKEVYIEAGKPVYSWSSFEKSKPWGEGSQARHLCQVQVFSPTLHLRDPSPRAGNGIKLAMVLGMRALRLRSATLRANGWQGNSLDFCRSC